MQNAFQSYFGAEWVKVLDTAEKLFAYNDANNAYFTVGNLRPIENLTLDQLLQDEGDVQPPNIIVS